VWASWSCSLGFPVMGIWGPGWSRTDVNSVSRSADASLLVVGDDFGCINLLNGPCIAKQAPRRVRNSASPHNLGPW